MQCHVNALKIYQVHADNSYTTAILAIYIATLANYNVTGLKCRVRKIYRVHDADQAVRKVA